MYSFSVQRQGEALFFEGILGLPAVEAITDYARDILSDPSSSLSIFIESKGGEDSCGAIMYKRISEMTSSTEAKVLVRTIAGTVIDSSTLALFMSGTNRRVYPSTVFQFHRPHIFATDREQRLVYVSYEQLVQCYDLIMDGGRKWSEDETIRSLLRRLQTSAKNPFVEFLYHTGVLLDLNIDCGNAKHLIAQYIEVVKGTLNIAYLYNAEILRQRTFLSIEEVEKLFNEERKVFAEEALSLGLAHGYV